MICLNYTFTSFVIFPDYESADQFFLLKNLADFPRVEVLTAIFMKIKVF